MVGGWIVGVFLDGLWFDTQLLDDCMLVYWCLDGWLVGG